MHPLRFLTIVAAIAPWLVAIAFVGYSPKLDDRPADYAACQKLHPERYCRLNFMQSTVATDEADGRR